MNSWREEIRKDLHRLDDRIDRLIFLFIVVGTCLGGGLLAALFALAAKS